MRTDKGRLFVLSGPSGAGKSTVINRVIAGRDDLQFSVSATTRAPRKGEVDGVNYHFTDRAHFEQMIENGELLEYVEYVDSYYGTPIKPILQSLEKGVNILLDIEVIGAGNVRKAMPDAVMIFLAPPSMEELERRLRGRADVPEEKIISRLERAKMECQEIPNYDYLVINDNVDDAVNELSAIILAEQCRTSNRLHVLGE